MRVFAAKKLVSVIFSIAVSFSLSGFFASELRASEASNVTKARQTWQLLDYIAIDYGGAIENGKVVNSGEYAEMKEFAETVQRQLREFPSSPDQSSLVKASLQLQNLIDRKENAGVISGHARKMAGDLIRVFPFPVSPRAIPNLRHGAQLYQTLCAACHGHTGLGNGPMAAKLDPPPTAFAERNRARERSVLALYQVISQGVQGTAMPSFDALEENDRWALAFYVGTLSYSDAERAAGASLWQIEGPHRKMLSNLEQVTQFSEAKVATRVGKDAAAPVTAYLRSNPAVMTKEAGSTAVANTRILESLDALKAGNQAQANELSLSAYLDAFEPMEPLIRARDSALLERVEPAMAAFRSAVASGSIVDAESAAAKLYDLLDEVDKRLAGSPASALTTYIGALTILVREGLEALLIVAAMIAFLRKADRPEGLRYVHWGWASALAAGGVTWFIATYFVSASGASRELTEGFSSLFAAAILLSVGIWMHHKSVAGRWQVYLREKMSSALGKRASWFLFLIAFIAVYREVFETVLFYIALWTEGNGMPLLAGLFTGIVLLGVLSVVLLRTSARLPIGRFFALSAWLVAVLAVVLVGKGIAGLQEAGVIGVLLVSFPRIDVLGIYPTMQTLLGQFVVVVATAIAFIVGARNKPASTYP